MIAGTHSGCGKTTVCLGIMAYLKKKGFRVQGFKVGPDFIDPGHHRKVTGRASHNLDGWMISEDYNRRIFFKYSEDADIAIVEGVMGLYDGKEASSARIAKLLNLPVILVVDASSMGESASAVVLGYKEFDPEVNIIGVIFNRIGSRRHKEIIEDAVRRLEGIEVFGFLFRKDDLFIPSRHLGLITAEETNLDTEKLSEWIKEGLDVEKLMKRTADYRIEEVEEDERIQKKVKVGIAKDRAFCFYYEENLRILEKSGAELIEFSPLKDERIPDVDGIIIGGGYPEVYSKELSQNSLLMEQIKRFSEMGGPVYAECGGFMYLMESISDREGKRERMVGIFPFGCSLKKRLRELGYRKIRTRKESILGPSGTEAKGHEFHYSEITDPSGVETIYDVLNSRKKEGFKKGNTVGSYIHLHFASNPEIAKNFVNSCYRFKLLTKERKVF